MFTYFFWMRAVKTGSVFWAAGTAISYFYMVSIMCPFLNFAPSLPSLKVSAWGGYVFIINLIPLHVFILMIIGRFSNRILVAYTTFYIVGLLFSMQVSVLGKHLLLLVLNLASLSLSLSLSLIYNRFLLLVFSPSELVNIWQLLVRTSSLLPLCSSLPSSFRDVCSINSLQFLEVCSSSCDMEAVQTALHCVSNGISWFSVCSCSGSHLCWSHCPMEWEILFTL